MNINWVENFNVAVTIMDSEGKILYMNEKSAKTFTNDGGKELIGTNLFDCHSKRSAEIINRLFENKETNVYTIEKKGVKKMIYQSPWYENGECMGLVEMSLEIPFDMPHFVR